MKRYVKTALLGVGTIVVFLFILTVDTIFYQVPSFIRIYRVEREIIIVIGCLLEYLLIKNYMQHRELSLSQGLICLAGCVIALLMVTFIPQMALQKYLTLWDNNPFLAEYPLIWNIVSSVTTLLVVGITILMLYAIRKIVQHHPGRYTHFLFRIFIWLTVLFAFGLNRFEDRYLFEPLTIFRIESKGLLWGVVVLLGLISLGLSYRKPWIDRLNKRQKYLSFAVGIVILPLGFALYISKLLTPVYAFSITVKGFCLAALGFALFYMTVSVVALLFRLPTASLYDRISGEILSFAEISRLIRSQTELQQVFSAVVRYACEITRSEACWLEYAPDDPKRLEIGAAIPTSSRQIEAFRRSVGGILDRQISQSAAAVLVHDIRNDDRFGSMKESGCQWRSLLAVPFVTERTVRGIIYAVKKGSYAYSDHDLNTLSRFVLQTGMAAEQLRPRAVSVSEPEERQKEIGKINLADYEIRMKSCRPGDDDIYIADIFPAGPERYLLYQVRFPQGTDLPALREQAGVNQAAVSAVIRTVTKFATDSREIFEKSRELLHENFQSETDLPLVFLVVDAKKNCISIVGRSEFSVIHCPVASKVPHIKRCKFADRTLFTCTQPMATNDTLLFVPAGLDFDIIKNRLTPVDTSLSVIKDCLEDQTVRLYHDKIVYLKRIESPRPKRERSVS